jgi:hypothetical protein
MSCTRPEAGGVWSGGGPLFALSTSTTSSSAVGGIERGSLQKPSKLAFIATVTGPATSRSRSR